MDKSPNQPPFNDKDNLLPPLSSSKPSSFKSPSSISPETQFLTNSLNQLKTGDDMDIMTCLLNLNEHLSLSSDQIADNPTMPLLLQELTKNLEKTYIPELVTYTLQCINYFLDISPAFTSILKRTGAIPKIIILMSAIEDFQFLEYIIKILEKISYENSFILLENNAFISLLNFIEFLGEGQRKSVMKACLNMVYNASSVSSFQNYIKPALPNIATLTKYNENDMQTTNLAILIFYHFITHLENKSYFKTNPQIENDILKYCFIENLCEILERFLINPSDKKVGSDLIKRILKIFTLICSCSNIALDRLLNGKILNLISEIIENEFGVEPTVKDKHSNIQLSNSNTPKMQVSFLFEILNLLTSFFPSGDKKEKILSNSNNEYYMFLCCNILLPLLKNIMLKSACSTLNSVIKFLITFTTSATKETLMTFLDSKALAKIISKLLDTKYFPYMLDIINILILLMDKTPEYFIVPFIREGIVENLNNFKFDYSKVEPQSISSEAKEKDKPQNKTDTIKNEGKIEINDEQKIENKSKEKEKEKKSQIEEKLIEGNEKKLQLKNEDNDSGRFKQNSEMSEENPNVLDEENDNDVIFFSDYLMEGEGDLEGDELIRNEKILEKEEEILPNLEKNENEPKKEDKNPPQSEKEIENIQEINELNLIIKEKEKKSRELFKKFQSSSEKMNLFLDKSNQRLTQKLIGSKNDQKDPYIPTNYLSYSEIKEFEVKFKEFKEKHISDARVKELLQSQKANETRLIGLKGRLIELKTILLKECEKKREEINQEQMTKHLQEIVDILSNADNELTLFEIESSQILLSLCSFFESKFFKLYNLLSEEDNITINKMDFTANKDLIGTNKDIFDKTKLLFNCFKNDKVKISNFIKMLQYTITSMNCFTIVTEEGNTHNLYLLFNQMPKESKKLEVHALYKEKNFCDNILKDSSIDAEFKNKLTEYNNAFKGNKVLKLLINSKTTFKDITSTLLSNTGVSFSTNEKYEVCLQYSLEIMIGDKKEIFEIEENWNQKNISQELSKKYSKKNLINNFILNNSFGGFPVFFGLSYKIKDNKKEDNKDSKKKEDDSNKNTKDFLSLINFSIVCGDIDRLSFEKCYYNGIIYNKNLYEIKRLMPSLYLMSLLFYSITKFNSLFNIPLTLFTKEEETTLFINSKVSLLISKSCRDGDSISKRSIPSWCLNLSEDFNFLSKFDSRFLLFKVSFEPRRSLLNLQNYLKSTDSAYASDHPIVVNKSMRLKVVVQRENILNYALKIIKDEITSQFIGYLEFEYENEIGNGIGPTLEFYSLVLDKIKEDKSLWYKTSDCSLYPNILNIKKDNKAILEKFNLLGFIIARALYDDRLIDIPLSRVFWEVILDRPVPLREIAIFDKSLGKTLIDFKNLSNRKKEFLSNSKNKKKDLEKKILYNGHTLESLDIYFTFPGIDLELKKGGSDIKLTMDNIEEYINLVYYQLFDESIREIVSEFRKGFNLIFSIERMKVFTSEEIEESICGSLETKWDKEVLFENIKAEHGIGKGSRIFKDLIDFMCSLDKENQKKFLTFVTGTSRLPIGGFKNLLPKLTVVNRTCEEYENPDFFLPTVMTCQNYLKLPEYSCYQILAEKITIAMNEGNNEFHLS